MIVSSIMQCCLMEFVDLLRVMKFVESDEGLLSCWEDPYLVVLELKKWHAFVNLMKVMRVI